MTIIKKLLIAVMIIMLVGCIACEDDSSANELPPMPLTKTYTAFDISIEYPEGWVKQEGESLSIATYPQFTYIAQFMYKDGDNTIANVVLFKSSIFWQPMTLDDFTMQYINSDRFESDSFETYELLSNNSTTLSGQPAWTMLYNFKDVTDHWSKVSETWATVDNEVYKIEFLAEIDRYDDFLSVGREMTDSFTITVGLD